MSGDDSGNGGRSTSGSSNRREDSKVVHSLTVCFASGALRTKGWGGAVWLFLPVPLTTGTPLHTAVEVTASKSKGEEEEEEGRGCSVVQCVDEVGVGVRGLVVRVSVDASIDVEEEEESVCVRWFGTGL